MKIFYDEITEKYKLDQDNIIYLIIKDTYNLTNKLNITNKLVRLNRKKNKGHQQNFGKNKLNRLINPTKTKIGLIAINIKQRLVLKSYIIPNLFCERTHWIQLNG